MASTFQRNVSVIDRLVAFVAGAERTGVPGRAGAILKCHMVDQELNVPVPLSRVRTLQ